jgi:pre-mRNA-splicing factor CWC26
VTALLAPARSSHISAPSSPFILMNMQAYLAEKYMSGPKADAILARSGGDKKKKKRKAAVTGASTSAAAAAGPSFIKDDDLSGWAPQEQEEDDEMKDVVVASDRGFKKRRTGGPDASAGGAEESGWQTVREGVKKEESPLPEDERPQVVGDAPAAPFAGGLVTRQQLQASRPAPKKEEQETEEDVARQQETVYRDASGRKIDMGAAKAEAARKKREMEEKEAKKMEWGKGLVQRGDEEKMREKMEKMKTKDLARRADDQELNEEQKAVDRWNDPAAAFLTVRLLVLCSRKSR